MATRLFDDTTDSADMFNGKSSEREREGGREGERERERGRERGREGKGPLLYILSQKMVLKDVCACTCMLGVLHSNLPALAK